MEPTINRRRSKRSVLAINGSFGPLAKGWPTGTRVNVSFTVGIRDKKKLSERRKFSTKRGRLFPGLFQ
jgi:hypothetical protein